MRFLLSIGQFLPYCYKRDACCVVFWKENDPNYRCRIKKTPKILHCHTVQIPMVPNPRTSDQTPCFVELVSLLVFWSLGWVASKNTKKFILETYYYLNSKTILLCHVHVPNSHKIFCHFYENISNLKPTLLQ